MPIVDLGEVRLRYTEHGDPDGFPVLCLAPGGLRSEAALWARSPWDPRAHLDGFRVIAMDQRNAGGSVGPIEADHGWGTYTADQLAVMDHVGAERFAVVGMCIGGAFIASLLQRAPGRVAAAVMMQPIGLHENRDAFHAIVDGWRAEIADDHPEADDARWAAFRRAMFGGDFVFSAPQEAVPRWRTPLLLLEGDDLYHPKPISDAIRDAAPDIQYVAGWKDPARRDAVDATIRGFLTAHGV